MTFSTKQLATISKEFPALEIALQTISYKHGYRHDPIYLSDITSIRVGRIGEELMSSSPCTQTFWNTEGGFRKHETQTAADREFFVLCGGNGNYTDYVDGRHESYHAGALTHTTPGESVGDCLVRNAEHARALDLAIFVRLMEAGDRCELHVVVYKFSPKFNVGDWVKVEMQRVSSTLLAADDELTVLPPKLSMLQTV